MNAELYKQLKRYGTVKINEPLAKHTTFKIGGACDLFVSINATDAFIAALQYLDQEGADYMILGGGSNMLASDEGYRGVVIKLQTADVKLHDAYLEADAGCRTVAIAQESIKAGLTGFEWGVGVPGTIGGAVRGNAGAMGGEMKGVVSWVDVYRDGEMIRLASKECAFGYRHSMFKDNYDIILRVCLTLEKGKQKADSACGQAENATGLQKALAYLKYRNKTQPQGWASTGCIFKNVECRLKNEEGERNRALLLRYFDEQDEKVRQFLHVGKISAGWLVEQVHMRGARVGNAQVSDTHGNFIVNLKGARAQDVQTLIEQIKNKVYDTYGIALEEEIQHVGFRD